MSQPPDRFNAPPPIPPAPDIVVVEKGSRKMDPWGVAVIVLIGLAVLIVGAAFAMYTQFEKMLSTSEVANREVCQQNLLSIDLAFEGYAEEQENKTYPPYADTGIFMALDTRALEPYLIDTDVFYCPADYWGGYWTIGEGEVEGFEGDEKPTKYISPSYTYFAHGIRNEAEGLEYLRTFRAYKKEGKDTSGDLVSASGTVFPLHTLDLRTDPERAAQTPVYIDDAAFYASSEIMHSHSEAGGHVLYLDGHVEYVPWGQFPYTDAFIQTASKLDRELADLGLLFPAESEETEEEKPKAKKAAIIHE